MSSTDSTPPAPAPGPDVRTGDPRLRMEGDGVAAIVFRAEPGPNVLGMRHLEGLDAILAELEHGIAAGAVAAVVVRSETPGSWIAGADLREVAAIRDAAEGTAIALRGQAVLRRLERLAVPTVAAVQGACMGAGAELALACSYRLAAASADTVIGFPEVRYGLLPAVGGTVRLPRLIGARAALEMVLTGRPVDAAEALAAGLVDAVYPVEDFAGSVLAFVGERLARGRIRTGARRGVARRLVEDTAPGRRALFGRVRRRLLAAEGGAHSAGIRALDVIARGIGLPLDEAFALEAEAFGALAVTPEAAALMHAFSLRRIARHPPGLPDAPGIRVDTVALLGGGATAGALAYLLASHGVTVRIRAGERASAADALTWARDAARQAQRDGALSPDSTVATTDRVTAGQGFGGFGTVDLALELAVGDDDRKRALLAEAESHLREGAVLATTALARPVASMAEDLQRPHRLAGIRFFPSPADPRIAEIVRPAPGASPVAVEGKGSRDIDSDAATATLHDLASRIGVTALGAGDGPGGVLHRLALAYVQEGIALLAEGAATVDVDAAGVDAGLRDGPLSLADVVGLPALARLAIALDGRSEDPARAPERLRMLVRREVVGREAGRGFYGYRAGRPPRANADVPALLRLAGAEPAAPTAGELRERLMLSLLSEAAALLEEGIVASPGELDLAMMLGFGFPARRGGLLFEADRGGLPALAARLEAVAATAGERFRPGPLLRRLAAAGGTFYGGAR
ncbi:MAG TPA: enoyl-CoA hydratase-related protein [Longimicrobiaceae bacterium]|nr:enoyl-CoA hydratase-related protein [Longimicrobiaceae bacterium]